MAPTTGGRNLEINAVHSLGGSLVALDAQLFLALAIIES